MFSTPTVAGDVLLIGSCAGTFYAFDKRTSKVRWSYNIHQDGNQTSFHGNPLITDQLVLIGTDKSCASGSIGHVYAFDRATGAVRWKYRTAGTPTDIARIGSSTYAASFVDELIALNLADGNLRWKFATGTPNPDCALPSAPIVVGDRVFYAGLWGLRRTGCFGFPPVTATSKASYQCQLLRRVAFWWTPLLSSFFWRTVIAKAGI